MINNDIKELKAFIMNRLVDVELSVLKTQAMITAAVNALPQEQRQNIKNEYHKVVMIMGLIEKSLPKGISPL